MCTAIVDVLRAGGAGPPLPAQLGVSPATAHRRCAVCTEAGAVAAAAPGSPGPARRVGGHRRVPRGGGGGPRAGHQRGSLTGAHPVEYGTPGAPLPVLTATAGLPQAVAASAAHTPDRLALMPLVPAIPAIGSRRGPRRRRPATRHADTGDNDHRRTWLRARRLPPRITRRGVQTSDRLGRHRGVIERWLAWLTGYRRLTLRYERSVRLFTAFLTLAATLTCDKRLPT